MSINSIYNNPPINTGNNANYKNYNNPDEEEILFNASSKTTWVDDACNAINSLTPQFVYDLAPKSFALTTESSYDFIIDNKLAFESLPRTADGNLDVEKIKSSLAKSTDLITQQNNQAEEMLNYGIYKDAINNTTLLVALLGPEVANVVTSLGGDYIPDWATEGVSMFDADLKTVLEIIEDSGIDLSEYGVNDIVDILDIKTSYEIQEEIKIQEDGLKELENFEIKNDEDAIEFLNKYLELTGTSFFCDSIDECYEIQQDENISDYHKINAYQEACGNSNILTHAQKNNLLTNIIYDIGIKYLIPVAINKINTIPTKIISTALPTVIEASEVATQNREDGQIANLRNFDFDTVIKILSEGFVDGAFVNLGGLGIFTQPKGTTIGTRAKGSGAKNGIRALSNEIAKYTFKGAIPNYSSWEKFLLTSLVPGSGIFVN